MEKDRGVTPDPSAADPASNRPLLYPLAHSPRPLAIITDHPYRDGLFPFNLIVCRGCSTRIELRRRPYPSAPPAGLEPATNDLYRQKKEKNPFVLPCRTGPIGPKGLRGDVTSPQ